MDTAERNSQDVSGGAARQPAPAEQQDASTSESRGATQLLGKRERPQVSSMDETAIKRNQALYNKHAHVEGQDRQEILAKRDEGMAMPLKSFHNQLKKLLILRFAGGSERLLDIACGRGGDLRKWSEAGIRYVKGLDSAEAEERGRVQCREAAQRLKELKASDPARFRDLNADFVPTTDIGKRVWREGPPFDAVTCMFALHYFFATEASAKAMLEFASANLRAGGHFFGTLPDGRNVLETMGPTLTFDKIGLRLKPEWKGNPQSFGSAYSCAISDTVTEGHSDDDTGSYEYLVYQRVLVPLAAEYDLYPVTEYDDADLDAVLDPAKPSADGSKLFRRFKPTFSTPHMAIKVASRLNCAFVFVKGREHPEGFQRDGLRHAHGAPPDLGAPAGMHTAEDVDGAADAQRASRPARQYKRPSASQRRPMDGAPKPS